MLSLTAQMADQKDWLGVVRNTLLTRAADHLQHQSQKQLDNNGRELKEDDSNQRYDHKDLTEVIFFLAHNLTCLKQEVNNLKFQIAGSHKELTHAKSRIDQLEMEAQDRHKDPDTEESQKKIHKLQKALIAAQQREQLEKAARENLEKELFHKESLLKTANSERLDKDARIRACERHLDNTKDELDMAQRELRLSYLQQTEPLQEKHLTSPHGVSIRTSPSQAQRVCNTQGTVNCKAQDPELAKEGAQHCYNAKPFSKRLLASQGQNCPHGNRPRYQTYHRKKPWMGASSSCRPRRTSNSRQQPPLPPRPSHSSHTDAAQGRMDTPASDPQELLMLVKELLEQFLPEKYSEAQDSDHSHNTTQPCSSQPRHKSRVTLQTSDCF
ncbi:hypothetical protein DPX16_1647 [Anabarilius grahami]|uniref:Uncharacterized protein n=2 Tax=Anabarilius grahami TaxID=495550 RepID=A0A3N0YQE9_ANAGA|nr:hypothetical protein DPX16_1647 [Anabarilius grahami]